jgi:hypothetical protein
MCDSGAVKLKAGLNVSTALTPEHYTKLINQAESHINLTALQDLTTQYSSLENNSKEALEDACSSLASMGAINYDMSGYTSRFEAVTMINFNWAMAKATLKLIGISAERDFTGANNP